MDPLNQNTACIILARGGSVGVPMKNLQKVGGVSLVGRAVRAAVAAGQVGATYVSTDDPAIAAEAARHGARVIDRPAQISDATASSEAGWLHALAPIRADMPGLTRLVMLQCTSPFITATDIDGCLDAMAQKRADCALSVVEDHGFLWGVDADGFGVGQNHDHTIQRQRRQDLPPQYKESGAIYCVDVAAFERTGQRFCGTVALFRVDHPPVEIDSPDDLALCQRIAAAPKLAAVPRDRLARVKAVAMDFDGVHTDNLVMTHQDGTEAVSTSRGDGMGLSRLRSARGLPMIIVSKERNPVVLSRAKKLNIPVQNAVDDKIAALQAWLDGQGLDWSDLLYVGNDVNDAPAMERAGLAACPSDAHDDVLGLADWVLPHPGGQGALRAMCDVLIATKPEDA